VLISTDLVYLGWFVSHLTFAGVVLRWNMWPRKCCTSPICKRMPGVWFIVCLLVPFMDIACNCELPGIYWWTGIMNICGHVIGLSALLVPQVLQKFNFSPSTIFSLKLVPKHLIRSTYHPDIGFDWFFYLLCHAGKFLAGFYQGRLIWTWGSIVLDQYCLLDLLTNPLWMAQSMKMEVWWS
jgi:hypothetical protein